MLHCIRRWSLLFVCVVVAVAGHAGPASIERVKNPVPGSYVVVLSSDTPSRDHAPRLSERVGARVRHVYDLVMNGFSIQATEQQALALAKLPEVVRVSETGRSAPAEVLYSPPVGMDRIDQRDLPLNGQYSYYPYSTPTNIYILDTGIDPHPQLGSRVVTNINFARDIFNNNFVDPSDYTDNGLPLNSYYHGTGSAVAAAGSRGIAYWAKVHNIRVCSAASEGGCFGDDIVAGLNYILQLRSAAPSELHIGNASFSGNDSSLAGPFTASINAGMAWTFAAGNGYDGQTGADACGFYPASVAASHSGALSVGAAHPETDVIEGYSNQGPCVEIFAPGQSEAGYMIGSQEYRSSGTSIAAPIAAGVFAIRWANSPASTPGEIEGLIKGVATPGVLTNIWPTSPNLLLYSHLPRRRPSGS
ncbi:MAG TPA: S8 family serine peptidase [Thermoanaerobaculia bacterium]|nr:S8 family serine peptidase [Thermoanaerobaculia bacterium]